MKKWNILGLIAMAVAITAVGIVIVSQAANAHKVQVKALTPEKTAITVVCGESEYVKVNVSPANATDQSLKWSTSDNTVASVDENGNISGVSAGECTVTVRSISAKRVEAEIKVTVTALDSIVVEPVDVVPDPVIDEPDDAGEKNEEPALPDEPDEPDEEVIIPTEGDLVTLVQFDRTETLIDVGQIDMPWVSMHPATAYNKNEIWTSSNPSIASVDGYGRITGVSAGECIVTCTSAANSEAKAEMKVTVNPAPDITGPTYINGIMIANKSYPLPANYNPGEDPAAAAALQTMIAAAKNDGISLYQISGFRSYQTQTDLYSRYILREGRDAADRYSARPGYSEHQTGLAYDLNSVEFSFADTKEGMWLEAHCHEYGFIIRYPRGKESVTGYMYEPWHVRYLGVETAGAVVESGLTLEEYLGIDSVYRY